ncbi:GNAT family N-acetyltransferase [uncultured Pseudokineococcus sp.]|uniref:GNAT family N-acetyltransferase n=1 Tax=uncultured Pseudokineococcus sp. TaxID=1642928 RepID=UPI00260C8203|nr:GNAT family N-acetyltransferase [uncultured Pseudokineococcus sp.]
MRIRPAVLEAAGDVAALALLRRAAASGQGPAPSDDDFGRRFMAWVRAQAHQRTFWLAESRGGAGEPPAGMRLPVGMVGLTRYERMPRPGEPVTTAWGYLGGLFVLPDHRDGGTGSALVEAALGHARETGLVRVVLSPGGTRAAPLYRRLGFRPAKELLVHPLERPGDDEDEPAGLDDLVHPLDLHPLD